MPPLNQKVFLTPLYSHIGYTFGMCKKHIPWYYTHALHNATYQQGAFGMCFTMNTAHKRCKRNVYLTTHGHTNTVMVLNIAYIYLASSTGLPTSTLTNVF